MLLQVLDLSGPRGFSCMHITWDGIASAYCVAMLAGLRRWVNWWLLSVAQYVPRCFGALMLLLVHHTVSFWAAGRVLQS
jgi:hypothetical protein